MAQPASVPPTALMRPVGTPQAPQVIDVCINAGARDDPYPIPTSRRCPHGHAAGPVFELAGWHDGALCTLDAMIAGFGPSAPALYRGARDGKNEAREWSDEAGR